MVSVSLFRTEAEQPNASEVAQLIELVCRRHSELRPDPNERITYNVEFARAIEFLTYQRRQRAPNLDYDVAFFIDLCARSHPLSYARHLRPFMTAVVASRVVYSGRHPYWSTALALGTTSKPDLSWRATLRLGSVSEPAGT